MTKDLLLISNSKVAGGKPFSHAVEEIQAMLGDRKKVTFIPYANPNGMGYDKYTKLVCPVFAEMGYELQQINPMDPSGSIRDAEALFVGGGNTWALLGTIKELKLLSKIKETINRGVPYIGSSAGANLAGLTIGNTNDMPAAYVPPDGFGLDNKTALGLVPFNINHHYLDKVTLTPEDREAVLKIAPHLSMLIDHQGEPREDRIREYHALKNPQTVVALREGAMLRVHDDQIYVRGITDVKVFEPKKEPVEYQAGATLDFLLGK
ncbi:dipeptidase PepE [Candidatus Woesearchaeota archaeon]|nr:dipeptidase PepE [Candidatus Woesearchaeota archaeon]